MGVKRAVDMVLDIAQHKGDEKVYTYGPLIHNPQTVELLKKRGIIPVDNLDDVREGTIIVRAHGISAKERIRMQEKGLRIIDATCPRVARVQGIIRKHAAQDYAIVIVGDKDHPEVEGLLGYTMGRGFVIERGDEVAALPDLEKVCVVAQTTQSADEYADVGNRIRERFAENAIFDTICDSTDMRQEEIKRLAAEMDAVIIVGGRNSANTRRLAKISEHMGTPTFHVESAGELKDLFLDRYDRIGISAGASTPNWIIEGVVDHIREVKMGRKRRGVLVNLWLTSVRMDVYSALGAGCLSLASIFLQERPFNILNVLMAVFYVFSVHTLNRFVDKEFSGIKGSFWEGFYERYGRMLIHIAFGAMLLSLAFSRMIGLVPYLCLAFISIIGVLYNMSIFPKRLRFRKLKDLPGTKSFFMALAWALVVAVVPYLDGASIIANITPAMTVSFLFTFSVVFVRSALSDLIDIQSDRLIGRETIPVVIGEENTLRLLNGISVFMAVLLAVSYPAGWTSSLAFPLLVCVLYMWICFELCDRKSALSGAVLNGLLETNYFIAGLSVAGWWFLKTALFGR